MATSATKSSAAKISPAAGNAWTGGSAVSAGGGRGLAPALKEPLRVIAHIDMDAFYAQIEQLRDAALTGRPVVVVQYPTSNHDIKDMEPDDNRVVEGSASSIIAVSYEARPFGVKRGMKAGDARKVCPELALVQVPTRNGKADISLYRHAGERVVAVLERAGGALTTVEKASIDEVYVDVTRAAHALLSSLGSHNSESSGNQQQQHQQQDEEGKGTSTAEGNKAPPAASPREDGGVSKKRWEDIGEGGWTAVLSATATTHVAGLSDDDASKEQQLADGVSWWARTKEAFTRDQELLSCGAAVVSRLRAAVRSELGYSCTAEG
ncbi:unnamed protein product [Ectocarpus sp. CCAP 1310/34]|nr:unnamed protein product [Ectocarpus sp. CCAP 1310/34]